MQHRISQLQPWAWVSVSAAIAAVALAGTAAEMTRRRSSELAVLDPRAPFDPYYGLAEYALNVDPASSFAVARSAARYPASAISSAAIAAYHCGSIAKSAFAIATTASPASGTRISWLRKPVSSPSCRIVLRPR